jgi:hypothetical protein
MSHHHPSKRRRRRPRTPESDTDSCCSTTAGMSDVPDNWLYASDEDTPPRPAVPPAEPGEVVRASPPLQAEDSMNSGVDEDNPRCYVYRWSTSPPMSIIVPDNEYNRPFHKMACEAVYYGCSGGEDLGFRRIQSKIDLDEAINLIISMRTLQVFNLAPARVLENVAIPDSLRLSVSRARDEYHAALSDSKRPYHEVTAAGERFFTELRRVDWGAIMEMPRGKPPCS